MLECDLSIEKFAQNLARIRSLPPYMIKPIKTETSLTLDELDHEAQEDNG